MPGSEPHRTDRDGLEEVGLVRLDPGVLVPHEQPRLSVLRGLVVAAVWRFPAALEELRFWGRTGAPGGTDPNRAFYRPDEVVDESGDGGPVASGEERLLPPH